MSNSDLTRRAEAVRRFNRFYTRRIGVLSDEYLDSPYSVAEARVIWELAHREQATASELGAELDLDPGYMSRIVRGLEKRDLLARQPSESDARQNILTLTETGSEAFAVLNARSRSQFEAMLAELAEADQRRLVEAMKTVEELLGDKQEQRVPYVLRPPLPGDIGWVVSRHGALYAQEYGWDEQFEALVASIVAGFVQNFKPKRERCWIAEVDGENAGSVFVVEQSPEVAKLRLLIVEPRARGLGIGKRLVDECIRFAPQAGYRKMTLWTQGNLVAARGIYERAGFRIVSSAQHHSFGHDLVEEIWELDL